MSPLGIIAGGGPLPGQVAAAAQAAGRAGLHRRARGVCRARRGRALIRTDSSAWAPSARSARRCATQGCTDTGHDRPGEAAVLFSLRPDAEGAKMLARIGRAAFPGMTGCLRAVMRVLSEDGFQRARRA